MNTIFRSILLVILTFLTVRSTAQNVCPGTPGSVTWECWQGLYYHDFGELYVHPDYPHRPHVEKKRYKTKAPQNYDDNIAGRLRGFIHVDSTHAVVFNVTGDDKVSFLLSSDSTQTNLVERAKSDSYTGTVEHDKYSSQTSDSIVLQAGVDYYFELRYVENRWGDHATLFWKTSKVSADTWNVISAQYLKDIGCKPTPCPPQGTACDDGNSATTDDVHDGYCNCMGKIATTDTCVGQRKKIEVFRYDTIPGGELNSLYEDADFPAMPHTSQVNPLLGMKSTSSIQNCGELMQGYLQVPVTGSYKFNVTGDNQTVFFLSSDSNPENKQAHQILVSGSTGMTEHNKYLWQTTSNITLQAGQLYYIEINSKQGGWIRHHSVFWQTPFTEAGQWKRIPDIYVYDYDCSLACIPDNTPCDDGNSFTNNDKYLNCECKGTPCGGPDCDDPLASYVPHDKCGLTSQLDNNPSNNWLSCTPSQGPNSSRTPNHWIQYDLGDLYEVHGSHIWNYNATGATGSGFTNVAIDYSSDGSSWNQLGVYTWATASGESTYSGFAGPDFMGVQARYILISSLSDSSTCKGIGKVNFTTIGCRKVGQSCDDGNIATFNDKYNNLCECVGESPDHNDCIEQTITLGDSILFSKKYSAADSISSISSIDSNSYVSLVGGKSVLLDVGFDSQNSSLFLATITPCSSQSSMRNMIKDMRQDSIQKAIQKLNAINDVTLSVAHSRDDGIVDIDFTIPQGCRVDIRLVEVSTGKSHYVISHLYKNKGRFSKRLRDVKLSDGMYSVIMNACDETITKQVDLRVK